MLSDFSIIKQKFFSPAFSVFIILLFHVSGLIGLHTSSKEWFLSLTPLNLLVSVVFMLRHERFSNYSILISCMLIFVLGFGVEVLGVNTGLIFGKYSYGPILGYKIFNTPVLIGVNWLIMVFTIGVIMEKFQIPTIVKALIGALIMTTVDYIIEPVAVYYNFWTWQGGVIPIQNYMAWYLFSFLFIFLFYQFKFPKNNKVAIWLFMTQVIFFLLLNLLI